MKVLKRGTVDSRWAGECTHCKTIAIAEVNEVKIVAERNGIKGDNGTAECPECGVKNGLKVYPIKTQAVRNLLRKNDLNYIMETRIE